MPPVQAAASDLDPTFGQGGRVTTAFGKGGDFAYALAIQSDGKIVAAGTVNGLSDFGLARYNVNGSLDSSFGTGGKVTTSFFGIGAQARAMAMQPDGKIVAAGFAYSPSVGGIFALARYNADGSLDSSFGSGGTVTTNLPGDLDEAHAVMIQSDGKIVAAGQTLYMFGNSDFAVTRYNVDGSLDSSFGSGGKVTTDLFGGSIESAQAVVIQPDDKIVAAGVVARPGSNLDFALTRYNADGSLDPMFGEGGKVTTDFAGGVDFATALALQSNGRIVAAGAGQNAFSGTDDFALVRYNADGGLDSNFGTGGRVTTDFFGNSDFANAIAIQSNGKIVAAGFADNPSIHGGLFGLARYNIDGSRDTTFGLDGKVTTDFPGRLEVANAVAIQADGKIVAAGSYGDFDITNHFALARYIGDSLDICLQDDSNGNILQFNSTSGEYLFTNCAGLTLTGKGSITTRGGIITLQQFGPDRRVVARIDRGVNAGTATIQLFSSGTTFSITDRNTTNNTCVCR